MVERRWAMVKVVRFCLVMISSSAACTTFSLALSSAEVASSRSMMLGFLMMARAMAMRCFCPPLSLPPRRPTCVLYPSPRSAEMNLCALASLAASSISACEAPGSPS
mmetsp:Transcript_6005/g.11919  ORF Transcript_6005/g.11919 Transcript_6005/m.11919 type:complete len:107 (+) Transcript_6005:418-738(+)